MSRRVRVGAWGLGASMWLMVGCLHSAPPTAAGGASLAITPALRRELHAVAASLEPLGFRARGASAAGFLLSGSHATLRVEVAAGECVTIVARATRGARDVDAALYTAEGRLLALDSEPNAQPVIQACSEEQAVRAYYVIQLYDGDGSFLAVPFFGPREKLRAAAAAVGGKPAFAEIVDAPEVAEDPVAAFSEGLRKRGYDAVGEPRRFVIAEGEHVRENLPVEAGQCYTVAAFASGDIKAFELRMLDEHGAELSVDRGAKKQLATQLCARSTAPYALESVATTGSGQVLLFVYRVDVMTAGGDAGLWLGRRLGPEPDPVPAAKQP
jgi:hypothetical protein